MVARVNATYPPMSGGGSFPIESLDTGMAIKEVIDELDSPAFESVIAERFGVDLAGRPKMYSLRGYTRGKDGQIHTDSRDKIITVLLYLNETWPHAGRPPAAAEEWSRCRRLCHRGGAGQRHAARVQALGKLLARAPSLRRSAPFAADELDDERGLEGLA